MVRSERLQLPSTRLIILIFYGFPRIMYHSLYLKLYPRILADRGRGSCDAKDLGPSAILERAIRPLRLAVGRQRPFDCTAKPMI
jgi:hypothetical protein